MSDGAVNPLSLSTAFSALSSPPAVRFLGVIFGVGCGGTSSIGKLLVGEGEDAKSSTNSYVLARLRESGVLYELTPHRKKNKYYAVNTNNPFAATIAQWCWYATWPTLSHDVQQSFQQLQAQIVEAARKAMQEAPTVVSQEV